MRWAFELLGKPIGYFGSAATVAMGFVTWVHAYEVFQGPTELIQYDPAKRLPDIRFSARFGAAIHI